MTRAEVGRLGGAMRIRLVCVALVGVMVSTEMVAMSADTATIVSVSRIMPLLLPLMMAHWASLLLLWSLVVAVVAVITTVAAGETAMAMAMAMAMPLQP